MKHELDFHKLKKWQKRKCIEWVGRQGGACLDFKNKDVILHDGGLFSIDKKKIKIPKTKGFKKLPNGQCQVIFTKKKYPHECYDAIMWFEDVDSTINWFKSLKRLLNSIGYRTNMKKQETSSKQFKNSLKDVKMGKIKRVA